MDKKLKRYIYVINDITNLLLNKEQKQTKKEAERLRKAVIVLAALLVASVSLNIILAIL